MKTAALTIIAVIALTCAPNAQNEFGPDAGNNLMTGVNNTGYGYAALVNNLTGFGNTG